MATRTGWWYDDCTYKIVLARPTVREDGTAQLLTDEADVLVFPDESEANGWLVDEAYEPFENLIEDFAERAVPLDPRIKLATATSLEELIPQMVITLEPRENSAIAEMARRVQQGSANARSNPNID
jgi:hypothetical protein